MDQKAVVATLKEYVAGLKEDEARNLHMRLDQCFSGDLEEVLLTVQKNPAVDSMLQSAESRQDFYAMLDSLKKQLDFGQKVKIE